MQVKHAMDVHAEPVEGVPGVTIRWLWTTADQAPVYALRLFEVQPGASTPYHTHPYEHEVYILSGQATLRGEAGEYQLAPGDTALVLPSEEHQFANAGTEVLRFLCGIPLPRARLTVTAQVRARVRRPLHVQVTNHSNHTCAAEMRRPVPTAR